MEGVLSRQRSKSSHPSAKEVSSCSEHLALPSDTLGATWKACLVSLVHFRRFSSSREFVRICTVGSVGFVRPPTPVGIPPFTKRGTLLYRASISALCHLWNHVRTPPRPDGPVHDALWPPPRIRARLTRALYGPAGTDAHSWRLPNGWDSNPT